MPTREVKGAIHVHSDYSDGSGTVGEIVSAAERAGIDFVILTDHDTRDAARDGLAGRHGKVLVVVGTEVSPSHGGHCLSLGEVDVRGYRWMPERYYLDKLRRDGADVYIAHPEGRVKPTFGIRLREWHVWENERFDGMEIWSYMHDWIENLNVFNMPWYYLRPDKAIDGPSERILGLWDRLNMHRRVSGIGALDAHAVRMLWGAFVAFEYEKLFKTILTHVMVEEWGESDEADTQSLREALRLGRAYAAYHERAAGDGFRFYSDGGHEMGDRGEWREGVRLFAETGTQGEISFVHNGRKISESTGQEACIEARERGVYRVEVRIGGRAWIYSNPIFLG